MPDLLSSLSMIFSLAIVFIVIAAVALWAHRGAAKENDK